MTGPTDSPTEPAIGDDQLSLLPADPQPGERWTNVNTHSVAVILKSEQRRYGWVTIRIAGSVQVVTIANFHRHFTPYKSPNGRQS